MIKRQFFLYFAFVIACGWLLWQTIQSGTQIQEPQAREEIKAPDEHTKVTVARKCVGIENLLTQERLPDIKEVWTDQEGELLARVCMAEAEGESLKGKALVIRTVLNRVKNESFPDSIEAVVFQPNQFTSTGNGRFDRVLPNPECYEALNLVKYGWDKSEGALFFESSSVLEKLYNVTYLYTEGNHKFYK